MTWYFLQFWFPLLLAFALGAICGYLWWRRQFARDTVTTETSTVGSCDHGPALAEKDAEIRRLSEHNAGLQQHVDAHASALADKDAEISSLHSQLAAPVAAGAVAAGAVAHESVDGDLGADLDTETSRIHAVPDVPYGEAHDGSAASELAGDVHAHDGETAPLVDTASHTAGEAHSHDAHAHGGEAAALVDTGAHGEAGHTEAGHTDAGHTDAGHTDAAPAAAAVADTGAPDDLERVEGIGPRIASALHAAGIHTFRALSEADVATLQAALEAGGLRFAPSLPTWARQARLLADGDEAGFKALTDRLVAGRDTGGTN